MPRTVFILGTDSEYCARLQEVIQAQIPDTIAIVTPSNSLPQRKESDTIIIAGELEAHVTRARAAEVLAELVRLSMTLSLDEMLDKVLAKSAEFLGETAFIVLEAGSKYQLEA